MTFIDYLVDSILILIVVRQVVESRFDKRAIILPLAIVAVVAHSYLHAIPTGGNDLLLIAGLAGVGVLLGTLSGLVTRVRADSGQYALVKPGWPALVLLALRCPRQDAVRLENANPGDVVQREGLQAPRGGVDATHHAATE
jgi:hypothetical protein